MGARGGVRKDAPTTTTTTTGRMHRHGAELAATIPSQAPGTLSP
jgi:hypothetical protein